MEKIYETIFFPIGFIFDSYECTSRKFLVNPSKQYLWIRKNRNEMHVAIAEIRQALHENFGHTSLLVLNWQIKNLSDKRPYWFNWIINLLIFDE
tara:strand:- start:95 stop:376 length:282 start_codon:yes stop_codon:yes gene_type:complete